ncbi:FtsX-like permease family protein [Ramlibacter algicola]|uniref:ABC transporter permease n=1 Tax=Ramlibacter algicola TaxID=2795217 RepID=A0A934PYI0_9BURK|nr:ABC transporter permease [Ramlibacter algicola]MBK0392885.1 ABC transporter permease [Ramlibacter algicola]
MRDLLRTFSWQDLRRHPWRSIAAIAAVMLGVALALAVHLINASALSEFSAAVRAVNGQPDLELRATQGSFDEALFARVAADEAVTLAGPVLELATNAVGRNGKRVSLRVLGLDALTTGAVAPNLVPRPFQETDRMALFAPGAVFLNGAASERLPVDRVQLQAGLQMLEVRVAGTVGAAGAPLAVMDIGAAQDLFGRAGVLSRIDVQLRAGTDTAAWARRMALPPGVIAAQPGDALQRVDNLSRAYRVNLTVLALVALFTGAFLVFSVLSLSVARRSQQFALLGVLGLDARARRRLVLFESAGLGAVGSLLGVALGTALALLALRLLGGDLGGGYFEGVTPSLHWSSTAAAGYALLGVAAALAGGWFPARQAERLPLAQALKGLRASEGPASRVTPGLLLLAASLPLALLPPVADLPIAAYLAVAALLVGGIASLPPAVGWLYDRIAPHVANRLLPLLAVERARRVRETAAVAVSGVVAALSLAVALTVMVASFRDSVSRWLDVLLPADLYVRTAGTTAGADTAFLDASLVDRVARLPGVARVATQRVRSLQPDPARPSVALLARQIEAPARDLPLAGELSPVPAGRIPVYASEALRDLHGARVGEPLPWLDATLGLAPPDGAPSRFVVAGIWRDYVRQTGAVLLDRRDYERVTGDRRVTDLSVWLAPGAPAADVQAGIRSAAGSASSLVEIASASEIRTASLRLFDRSFAVTYWLQAVAIGIGLFGVAASFSAQVLARRKEFGLLAHLGLTRSQILGVVAGEGAAWTVVGALAGIALGLGVSLVLVHVVNPQSFHWTMDLHVPWVRLAVLGICVVIAGTLTAWLAGRAAAGRDAVLAVKEDW